MSGLKITHLHLLEVEQIIEIIDKDGGGWVNADVANSLYDALEKLLVDYVNQEEYHVTHAEQARDALAKARGEL